MDFFDAWRAMERGAAVSRPNWEKIELFYLRDKHLWGIYKDHHEKRMTVVPVSIIVARDWQIVDESFALKMEQRSSGNRTRPDTLRESIEKLRAIPATWKYLDDPIAELRRIRQDPDYIPDFTIAEERRKEDEAREHPLGYFDPAPAPR